LRFRALLVLASVAACGNGVGTRSEGGEPAGNSNGSVPAEVGTANAGDGQVRELVSAGVTWDAVLDRGTHGTAVYATASNAASSAMGAMGDARAAAIAVMDAHKAVFGVANAAAELTVQRVVKDELGMTHVRMQQKVGDLPVLGRQVTAHFDAAGRVTAVHSHYAPGITGMDTTPGIGEKEAQAAAFAAIARDRRDLDAGAFVVRPAASLAVFAPGTDPARLGYAMTVRSSKDALVFFKVVVDAKTGELLKKVDNLQSVNGAMEGMGAGVLGDSKKLEIQQTTSGLFRLVDLSRTANGIVTLDAGNSQNLPGDFITSQAAGSGWDSAAVDAHAYAGLVYDYYKKTHARTGIDGADGQIVSTVHFSQNFDNAFWNGEQMIYGDGDGTIFREFTAGLDVIAHELTHGVTQNTSQLDYQGQTGALNESVSDIFGSFVEHMFQPDDKKNWIMGDRIAIGVKGTRDFIHPANGGPKQPAHMSQLLVTQQDNGGVHLNSGIPNNAMFLMTMGGTNDVSMTNVPAGIGWDKAEALWYRANTHYFMETTDFAGAAQGTLTAAKDLNFSANEQAIVECAWIATGVITGTCKAMAPPPPPAATATNPSAGNTGGAPGTIAQGPTRTTGGSPTTGPALAAPGGTPNAASPIPGSTGTTGPTSRAAAGQGYAPVPAQAGGCSMGGEPGGGGEFITIGVLVAAALGSRRRKNRELS
jgi:thermolysin